MRESLLIPDELRRGRMEEALVCFITAEEKDEEDVGGVARAAVKEIEEVAGTVKTKHVAA